MIPLRWGRVVRRGGARGFARIGFRIAELGPLAIMLAVIPLQVFVSYKLSKNMDRKASMEERFSARLFTDHFTTWLSLELWRQLHVQRVRMGLIGDVSPRRLYPDIPDPKGECPAVEVMRFRHPQGYYAMSHVPRGNRNGVLFRVGNIVQHRITGYRGVVVGWDLRARAPHDWFKAHYEPDNVLAAHIRSEPHYAVLVDIRDRSPPQMVYVPQHLLIRYQLPQIAASTPRAAFEQVVHPVLEDYFVDFNGLNYVPRPWLRALYPRD
ncbi:uncharacterized protein LOC111265297 isoform X2 [Varroa jacobsoni]|uniref:Hemimethylated DNA-binding domain-containing protein n=1 Tax=Varroa destructor TaxID=109461 RepID=A0A7M7JM20_VARDE|nr:uncharacterized protein LOC111247489 isoform X2 [Varroa destructor]XP_022697590.1 uncharacterized protein LOC111265297 isoform X2 [Varroa jacobsoni]